jgi:PIN domain nuclease of toxin-antitoxin system
MHETRRVLSDPANAVFVSVVSLWEILVKSRIGKLKVDIVTLIGGMAPRSKLQPLGIVPQHLMALNTLPFHQQHCDSFDHLLIAQAIAEDMTLVTRDRNAPLYPVRMLPQ